MDDKKPRRSVMRVTLPMTFEVEVIAEPSGSKIRDDWEERRTLAKRAALECVGLALCSFYGSAHVRRRGDVGSTVDRYDVGNPEALVATGSSEAPADVLVSGTAPTVADGGFLRRTTTQPGCRITWVSASHGDHEERQAEVSHREKRVAQGRDETLVDLLETEVECLRRELAQASTCSECGCRTFRAGRPSEGDSPATVEPVCSDCAKGES